eukprot:CAMPEP_0167740348 /NCGR_PEP_ID=MMETSP0110_2-20121227/225_1 /TAXON_ID=629695 /ORGANISM="Gymnochlora sp., Strain CCMP2014" /LENGTH=143 /DNA_ID=CAMNT_0007624227 /DNA_START=33 /DNA_END=461 /DNA_ORIENTATION=-
MAAPSEPTPGLIAGGVLVVLHTIFATAAYFTTSTAPQLKTAYEMKYMVFVAVIYYFIYNLFIFRQGLSKQLIPQYAKKVDRDISEFQDMSNNFNRTPLNALEQMGPFMASFWLYGGFVNPMRAAYIGAAYVFFFAIYPICYGW